MGEGASRSAAAHVPLGLCVGAEKLQVERPRKRRKSKVEGERYGGVKKQDRSARIFACLTPSLLVWGPCTSVFHDSPYRALCSVFLFYFLPCEECFVAQAQMLVNISLVSFAFPSNICANRTVISSLFLVFSEGSDQS